MISGILLMLLTGLMWVGIGAVISAAAAKRLDLPAIQAVAAAWIVVPCLIFLWLRGGADVHPPCGTGHSRSVPGGNPVDHDMLSMSECRGNDFLWKPKDPPRRRQKVSLLFEHPLTHCFWSAKKISR